MRIETCWQGQYSSGPSGADFCLVLRETHDCYYEVMDEVWLASWDFLGGSEPRHMPVDLRRTMGSALLYLCLDIEDTASIAMLLNDRRAQAASARLPGDNGISLVSKTKRRQRFSSYAILATDEESESPLTVNGIPTVDGKLVPCAKCGGLLDPTTASPS